MGKTSENICGALVYIFNPISLIIIGMVIAMIFAVSGDIKVDIEKERTKQVAMQLEIKKLEVSNVR